MERNQVKSLETTTAAEDDNGIDPYLKLGFGLITYRSILESLTLCFILIALITMPI
jgi:hypothetical protein